MTSRRNRSFLLLLLCIGLNSCSSRSSSEGLGVYPKAVGAADEGFAIQAMRTIATAEAQLKVTHGTYGDFAALTEAGLLDARFAGSTPNLKGYRFTITASDTEFSANADPQTTETQHTTGSRHFYIDSAENNIHVNPTGPASKSDPTLERN